MPTELSIKPDAPGDADVDRAVPTAPVLDIAIPVYNEERDLAPSIERLRAHIARCIPYSARITIADNASTDGTSQIGRRLAAEHADVVYVRLAEKGRGRALREVWQRSDADVLVYMDVDLSTHLSALLPLVAPLISGHSDLAIGSRLARGSRVVRGAKREVISRGYNLILRGALAARFSDAQCGFKAIRRDVASELLPLVRDTGWFFDTELLVLAQRSGLRVHEVPVDWVDDPDSRVAILPTAIADLKGVARLGHGLLRGSIPLAPVRRRFGRHSLSTPGGGDPFARQLGRFVAIGVASTAAHALLFVLLREWLDAQWANALALMITAVANTAANRRLTFGIRAREGLLRHHMQGLAVFAFGLGLTALALAALRVSVPDPSRSVELAVLVIANLVTTITRFVALRTWVFAHARVAPRSSARSEAS
jgi:putative flippase GtrA